MNMQIRIVQFFIIILFIFHSIANAAEKFSISAKPMKNGVRVIITAGENNIFNIQKSKGKLLLNFKDNFILTGNITGSKIIKSQYVTGNSIVFLLAVEDYEVRKFISDKFIGVDISETKNIASKTEASPGKIIAAEETKDKEVSDKMINNLVELASKQKHETKKKPKNHNKAQHVIPQAQTPTSESPPPNSPSRYYKYPDPLLPPRNVISATKAGSIGSISKIFSMKVIAQNQNGIITISFPWDVEVAASSFYRAGYLWIIFNKKTELILDDLISNLNKQPKDFNQIASREYTILRIKGNELSNYKVTKNQNDWVLQINTLAGSTKLLPQNKISEYRSQFSRGVFFTAENMDRKTITLIDPTVGDLIMTVLFYSDDTGVALPRNFVDFSLLASPQGFTIIPFNDNVQLNAIMPGLEITLPDRELSVAASRSESPLIPDTPAQSKKSNKVYSLLPYTRWTYMPPADFLKTKQDFSSRVKSEAALYEQNKEVRVEYAGFLFAQDMWSEADSMLYYIESINPDKGNKYENKFLHGVVNTLRGRYDIAKTYFDQIDMNNVKDTDKQEIKFWKAVLSEAKGVNDSTKFSYLQYSDNFITNYSYKVKTFLIFLNLKNSIESGDYNSANELLSTIEIDDYEPHDKNMFLYYQGLLLYKMGDHRSAEHFLQKLTAEIDDPECRARATLALVKMHLEDKKTKTDEALKQLNSLRNTWRGDDFEERLLTYIASLYESKSDYVEALRIWKTISSSLNNLPDSLSVAAHMSEVFYKIFNQVNGTAKDMPDFKSVSLFYEFRELTPIGKSGDDIIEQLVSKLVKLDLLEKAEGLLDHQYKYRLDGQDRLKAIQKLALIYLIDKKPQSTINLLNDTKDDFKNYPNFITHNKELYAKALIDESKPHQAIDLLKDVSSDGADDLLIEIYWATHTWDKLEALMQPKIDEMNHSKELKENQVYLLIKYALTLSFQDKKDELYALGQKFMGKIPDSISAKVNFDLITSKPENIDYTNLEGTLGIDKYTNFLEVNKKNLLSPPQLDK